MFGEKNIDIYEIELPIIIAKKKTIHKKHFPDKKSSKLISAHFGEDFWPFLIKSGFNLNLITLFVLEGLVPYLDKKKFESLLSNLCKNACSGSSIVFDFCHPALEPDFQRDKRTEKSRRKIAKYIPLINYGIDFLEIEDFLKEKGFVNIQRIVSKDLQLKYFGFVDTYIEYYANANIP